MSAITTDLERDLLALLFDPKYSDMSLDQIRTLASGYVYPEKTLPAPTEIDPGGTNRTGDTKGV